jgi:hypothetical protein
VFGLAALLTSATCALPPFGSTSPHYVDFVKWNGIDYLASFSTVGRAITTDDLGAEHFRVTQTLVTAGRGIGYLIQDGDAAFVPTGDPVYTMRGYAPTFRLAARHDGRLVLYEANVNPGAKRGGDLFDIAGKVTSIAILDQKRNTTVIGRITEPARVAELVRAVLDGQVGGPAPVDGSAGRPASLFATVSFELRDGTATVRGYDVTRSTLTPNVTVAGSFRDAISALLANAPTPTPAPAVVNLARRYDLTRAQSVSVKRPDRPGAQPVRSVAEWSSAFDADMPARRAADPISGDIVVIFSFPDRYVSMVYDRSSDTLRVAVPDDELAVRATDAFKALLARE